MGYIFLWGGRIKGANPPQFAPAAPAWPLATAVSGHFNSRPPTRALRPRERREREISKFFLLLLENSYCRLRKKWPQLHQFESGILNHQFLVHE